MQEQEQEQAEDRDDRDVRWIDLVPAAIGIRLL